jgi:hypothetical protein
MKKLAKLHKGKCLSEKYINAQILSEDLKVEDIKIYECRDSKLNKILK